MSIRHLLLGAVTALSLGLLHAPAQAAASGGSCDRACMNDIVEKYLAAMAAHNPAKGPIANSYFTGLQNNDGHNKVPFAPTCHRIESGAPTTNVPVKPGQEPSTLNMGCTESFGLGYFREDTDLRDRRFPVVDEERGLVYALVFFDHDAVLRSYKLNNGKTQTVKKTSPWTWEIAEVFQIKNGLIDQVEAVVLPAPYRMKPNWKGGELASVK